MTFFILKVHIKESYVAFELGIGQCSVTVRMLPCPNSGMFFGLGNITFPVDLCVNKCYISVIGFGFFIHQFVNSLTAGQCHDDHVDLLCKLV